MTGTHGYYLSVIDPKTGEYVKEIGNQTVYNDLPVGWDASPMVNGFSSTDRKYFC